MQATKLEMRRLIYGAAAALLALCPLGLAQTAGASPGVPRFENAACPFTLGAGMKAGSNVVCGYLVVPENRARSGGRTIRLAVAIFKSPSPTPAPDPVIFLQGGPGGAIISNLAPYITRDSASYIVGNRDLILLDQRGDGYSQPALSCRELIALKYQYLDRNASDATQIALQSASARQCRDRLLRAGNDLNAYTSLADAADVADLRVALGYKEVNLYGVSYGTRVALTMMRAYPAGIRSVVLDSTYPPQINGYDELVTSGKRAFDVLFAGCAADPACNRAYPHLQSVFYSLVQQLNAHPISFRSTAYGTTKTYAVLLTGDVLADTLFSSLYATDLIPKLPAMIYGVMRHDYGLLGQAYGETGFDDTLNTGVYYAVQCGEDAPFTVGSVVNAAIHRLPAALWSSQLVNIDSDLAVCSFWGAPRVPAAQKQPVVSAIPTLVLAGQYDPITPPANGALAARTLSHSYFFEYPGLGHGVYLNAACPYIMTTFFLNNPLKRPDSSCIASMKGPAFVLPQG